jgi:hypothetical protein
MHPGTDRGHKWRDPGDRSIGPATRCHEVSVNRHRIAILKVKTNVNHGECRLDIWSQELAPLSLKDRTSSSIADERTDCRG